MTAAPERRRADTLLVERGLFESRARAQEAISAGLVTIGGQPLRKASTMITASAEIAAEAPHPWVSRGGVKLAAALERFGMSPEGQVCLDVGASTGGFTEVLLARGARRVYAADVGHGQIHPRIAADPRVISLEGVDARALDATLVPCRIGLVSIDVSFISLKLVLPGLKRLLSPSCYLVALIKPQFEAGRNRVGRGGIVRDEAVRQSVLGDLVCFARNEAWEVTGTMPSPIAGGDGNREFLLGARLA